MNRIYSTVLALMLLVLGNGLCAQQLQPANLYLPASGNYTQGNFRANHPSYIAPSSTIPGLETAVTCSQDTVQYAINKATGLRAININNATSAQAASQYFDAPQPITLSGFRFYGYSITLPTMSVTAQLFLAGADSMPTGTALASVSVTIDSNTVLGLADYEEFANFTTPVTVSQPYVLVILNASADQMGLICNDYTPGDGAGEWLASAQIGANWIRSYSINIGGTPFNADWLLEPFATYDLNTTFTYNPPCLTNPNTLVTFTSNSSPILSNRMYNVAAFVGSEFLSHSWNFGDGSGVQQVKDTTHNYVTPSVYSVTKTDTMYGWSTLCINDTTAVMGTAAVAGFTSSSSGLSVTFTNTSVGANAASWNFGDGNTSTLTSPLHNYATPGSYNVCLTATGPCGPTTICSYVTVVGPALCGPDSVQYPLAKLNGLSAISINNSTSAQGISQYYNAPQPINIYGFEFFGYSSSLPVVNLTCSIFAAGADSMPTGTALATATFGLDTVFGGGGLNDLRRFVGFSNPVTVSAPYVVVISNPSANNVALLCNDYTIGDGQGEFLASADLFGTWTRGYSISVGGNIFDADWLVHPLVTYDLQSGFVTNPTCLGSAGTVTFTNTSSPILSDRMYNVATFIGQERLSYTWDFGDASPQVNAVDTTHAYASGGPWTVTLTDTIFGWTSQCAASAQAVIAAPPSAAFSSTGTSLNRNFTDLTAGAITGWFWDFGDGNTATTQNPSHSYANPGNYTVCLTVTDSCGSDSTCQTINVTCPVLTPAFSQSGTNLTYTFTDQTVGNPVLWIWDFGDGGSSNLQNPTHTYSTPGTYTVCMFAADSCSLDSTCTVITVTCPAPASSYSTTTTQLTANFTDLSSGTSITGWLWDFGDGGTSTLQNPSHVYATPGTYTVCLTITDACGSDSSCSSLTVSCAAPTAFFTNSTSQLTATFTDASSVGTGATFFWDFGDGNTSNQQNPTHTYTAGGLYTVCLFVNDVCGSDTICLPVTIVCPVPTSFFSSTSNLLTANFTNQSTGTGTVTWAWDFGDGNTSTQQNPSHQYSTAGVYTVCLTTNDDCGADTICLPVTVVCPAPVAAFSATTNLLNATFSDLATGSGIFAWAWSFGDGNTSNQQNPAHTYAAPGNYIVCLTVTDSCGSDSSCQSVNVTNVGLEDGLAANVSLFPNPAQNQVKIALDLPSMENVAIRIFNPQGQLVREFNLENIQRTEIPVDLRDLSNGAYLVNLLIGDQQVVKRLNVQR